MVQSRCRDAEALPSPMRATTQGAREIQREGIFRPVAMRPTLFEGGCCATFEMGVFSSARVASAPLPPSLGDVTARLHSASLSCLCTGTSSEGAAMLRKRRPRRTITRDSSVSLNGDHQKARMARRRQCCKAGRGGCIERAQIHQTLAYACRHVGLAHDSGRASQQPRPLSPHPPQRAGLRDQVTLIGGVQNPI